MRWQLTFLYIILLLIGAAPTSAGEWIVDHDTGCAVWNPSPQPGETIHWSGQCKAERASGYGTLRWWRNGIETQVARGYFNEGKLDGDGLWWWASGHQYQGEFSDGEFEGKGIFTWPSGARYSGEFLNNERHGLGHHQSSDGARYRGPYWQGDRHGEGSCYTPGLGWTSCRWHGGERIDGLTEV